MWRILYVCLLKPRFGLLVAVLVSNWNQKSVISWDNGVINIESTYTAASASTQSELTWYTGIYYIHLYQAFFKSIPNLARKSVLFANHSLINDACRVWNNISLQYFPNDRPMVSQLTWFQRHWKSKCQTQTETTFWWDGAQSLGFSSHCLVI